jgi:hypothetical protein
MSRLILLIFGLVSDGPAWLPAGVGCAAARSRQDSSAGEGGSARSNPFHQVQQFFLFANSTEWRFY